MKFLFSAVLLIVVMFFLLMLSNGWIGGDGYKYIDGSTLSKSIDKEDDSNKSGFVKAVPRKVVYYDYDSDFIIATRIVLLSYTCKYKDNTTFLNMKVLPDLEYWVIDKKSNIVYISTNEEKIKEILSKLNINLLFDFSQKYTDEYKWLKNLESLDSKKDLSECKQISYPEDGVYDKVNFLK